MRVTTDVQASTLMVELPVEPFPPTREEEARDAFATMRANVTKITDAGEKERWMANVDLWRTYLSHVDAEAKADAAKMTALIDRIKSNIAKVEDPGEKERWLANVELWELLSNRTATRIGAGAFEAPFARMRASIATIDEEGEAERWLANRDLWEALIEIFATPI